MEDNQRMTPKKLRAEYRIIGFMDGNPAYCEESDHETSKELTVPVKHVGDFAIWYPCGLKCWVYDPEHRLKTAEN